MTFSSPGVLSAERGLSFRWLGRAAVTLCAAWIALGGPTASAITGRQARARVVEVTNDFVSVELEPHAVVEKGKKADLLYENGTGSQLIGSYVVWHSQKPRIILWRIAAPKTLPIGQEVLVEPVAWETLEAARNADLRSLAGPARSPTPAPVAPPPSPSAPGPPASFATGRVTDVSPGTLTIRLDREDAFLPELMSVELTCDGGGRPFRVGGYSVQDARPPEFVLRPVDVSIPPSAGQKVSASPVYWKTPDLPAPRAATLPASPAAPAHAPSGDFGAPAGRPASPAAEKRPVRGKVVRVEGQNVWISCPPSERPGIGARVELKYVTSAGLELDVGTWKVESIQDGTIFAVPADSISRPRVGLDAVIR